MMQIVIKIPNFEWLESEEDFKTAVKEYEQGTRFDKEIRNALINGKPLPEHHGRIGDLDAVMSDISTNLNEMTNLGFAVTCEYLWAKLNDAIYNAPTIIEADTEGSESK